jgi:acyl-CoA synthetase (AMP-forming)/AMP-acid ligase II
VFIVRFPSLRGEAIAWAVERAASNIYLQFAGCSYTYGETHEEISRYAAGLKDIGVRPGETVALMIDNSPDAIFLWYAAVCLGAIVVPINSALKATQLSTSTFCVVHFRINVVEDRSLQV